MPAREHLYRVTTTWTGDLGQGTRSPRGYRRDVDIAATGKAAIAGSSGTSAHGGDPSRWNPDELLIASLSACHQLCYLYACARAGVVVLAYEDEAEGVMAEEADGSGQFTRAVLRPKVMLAAGSDAEMARSLHTEAHRMCFIAASVNFPIVVELREHAVGS